MSDLRLHVTLRYLALPVILSIAIGLLVVYDSNLASYHPLWQFALDFETARNYLWTGTIIGLVVAIALAANYRAWLFAQRYRVAFILLISSPALGGLNLIRLDPPDVALVVGTLFWVASVTVEDRQVLVPRVVVALMLGLFGFVIGSIMTNGVYIVLALPSVISKLMIVFLLANLIATPRDHDLAIKALIVVALISAGLAILIAGVYLLTGYAFTLDDRKDEHFKCFGWICMFRATALTPTPQVLGHVLIMGLGLTLFLRVRLWLQLLLPAVLIVGAITTLSVGVILCIGAVLVLFPIYRWPGYFPHILTTYLTAAWLSHVTGTWAWIYQAANELLLAAEGVNIRVWTYRGAAELMEKSPIFGIGALRQIPGSMHFTTPHNTYMQVALELGLPAAFLFVSLLAYLFLACWRIAATTSDASTRSWMHGMLLGYTGMLVHFMSEPMYPNNLPWTYMGLMTAAIVVYGRNRTNLQLAAIQNARSRSQRIARTLRNTSQES